MPGGGIAPGGAKWIGCRPGFFLPVRVLSRLFRRLFLKYPQKAFDSGKLQFFPALQPLRDQAAFVRQMAKARSTEWVVYAKAPFAGPEQVLDYVGRYTHRVAISNNRLLDIEQGQVSFRWKDYRQDSERKTMTLSADEFIRRIRYYGFLANRFRREKLAQCRQLLGMRAAAGPPKDYRDRYEELTGCTLRECPQCHRGRMVVVELLPRIPGRLPPIMDSS